MRILVTGACGFAGSTLAARLPEILEGVEIFGMDNFIRPGSERNRAALKQRGVKLVHGDVRAASDFEGLPKIDWVIDAAANPSVLAGVDGRTSSRQLVEHNLQGTINLLELCKRDLAGFILLSTSRIYSIPPLAGLPVAEKGGAFVPEFDKIRLPGFGTEGIREEFSTEPPLSLYGSSKLASETLALEYGQTFGFPVWINRCGVMAGGGQFGRPDQGIFAYWIHSWREKKPLKYIGFGGNGFQARDCLHPRDLAELLAKQMEHSGMDKRRIQNLSGGMKSATSLAQLSEWCAARFGGGTVGREAAVRPFDLPWIVLDSTLARRQWGWEPRTTREEIFEEIARHAEANPDWIGISAPL